MKLMKAQRRQISKKGPQDSCNYLIIFSFDVFKMDSPRSINTDIWQEKLICSSIENILFNGVITSTRCSIKETLFMSLKQRSTSTKWLGSYFMLEQEQWIIFFTKNGLTMKCSESTTYITFICICTRRLYYSNIIIYIIEEILLWISYAKRGILTIFLLHLGRAMHLRILLASSNYH